jgi:hypothetical protein
VLPEPGRDLAVPAGGRADPAALRVGRANARLVPQKVSHSYWKW